MATLIASSAAEGLVAGLGVFSILLVIILLLLLFSPLLCWGELMKIRKILERMERENGGAATAQKPAAAGGYSSVRKSGGWNR